MRAIKGKAIGSRAKQTLHCPCIAPALLPYTIKMPQHVPHIQYHAVYPPPCDTPCVCPCLSPPAVTPLNSTAAVHPSSLYCPCATPCVCPCPSPPAVTPLHSQRLVTARDRQGEDVRQAGLGDEICDLHNQQAAGAGVSSVSGKANCQLSNMCMQCATVAQQLPSANRFICQLSDTLISCTDRRKNIP